MKSFFYHLKSALENIRLNQTMAFFSLVSLSLTLMLFGLFLLFYYNVQDFVQTMRESVQFSIYLKEESSRGEGSEKSKLQSIKTIEADLKNDTRITSFIYISKEEALETFNTTFQDSALLERLGENPFPASFEVKVKPSHQELEKMQVIIDHFKGMTEIEEVRYGSEWLNNLLTFLKFLKAVGLGIGAFLALTVTSNIANTIRLHFYNRREEIETMKLIGATHGFIKIPFVLEGIFMGGVSGVFSLLFLFLGFEYSKDYLHSIVGAMGLNQGLQFLPVDILIGLTLFGSLLGGVGSFISLSHLLTLRNPELARKKLKKGKSLRFFFFSMGFAIFFLIFMPTLSEAKKGSTQGIDSLRKQIQKERSALKKLESKIKNKKEKQRKAKKKERSILSDLERIDRRARLYRKEARLLEAEIGEKEEEETSLVSKISVLKTEIGISRQLISKRLRILYKEKQSGGLKILFASKNYPDLLRSLYYLNTAAKKEDELLSKFKTNHVELSEKKDRLQEVKGGLLEDRSGLARKLSESRTERRQKKQILSRVKRERGLYKRAILEMTEASQQVRSLIARLQEQKKVLPESSAVRFSMARGRLNWPNNGKIVSRYGRQKHPKFDTIINKKGIEISPGKGAVVRNIFDGTVVYADWFRGYGMMIMIDHGENYYSLYAHLEKLMVGIGDRIKTRRVIGQIGGTGLSQGSKLYFEIRHQGKPINPTSWLKKRG